MGRRKHGCRLQTEFLAVYASLFYLWPVIQRDIDFKCSNACSGRDSTTVKWTMLGSDRDSTTVTAVTVQESRFEHRIVHLRIISQTSTVTWRKCRCRVRFRFFAQCYARLIQRELSQANPRYPARIIPLVIWLARAYLPELSREN